MADFFSTKHITKQLRSCVKQESRRLRLSGVRAKILLLCTSAPCELLCLRAFSWADITTIIKKLPCDSEEWENVIREASTDDSIHGIIIDGRFSTDAQKQKYCDMLPPHKDIMCSGASAIAAALTNAPNAHIPCMAQAIMELMRYCNINCTGKNIMLFGRGNTMRAIAFMLMNAGACVTISPTSQENTIFQSTHSDIIITKQDRPQSITAQYISENQIIIDLGKNTGKDSRPCGDVLLHDVEMFIKGIYIPEEDSFYELMDYILCSYVLKSAALYLKSDS